MFEYIIPESFRNQTEEKNIAANPKVKISSTTSKKNRVRMGMLETTSNSITKLADKINWITVGVKKMEEKLIAINTGKKPLDNNLVLEELDSL